MEEFKLDNVVVFAYLNYKTGEVSYRKPKDYHPSTAYLSLSSLKVRYGNICWKKVLDVSIDFPVSLKVIVISSDK